MVLHYTLYGLSVQFALRCLIVTLVALIIFIHKYSYKHLISRGKGKFIILLCRLHFQLPLTTSSVHT